MNNSSSRTQAIHLLYRVIHDRQSLSRVLADLNQSGATPPDMKLIQELVFGVLRWEPRLSLLIQHLVTKPIKSKDKDIELAMMLGLYQLEYMRVPAHAAVATAVEVALELGKKWAKGFINAVLRSYQKQAESLAEKLQNVPVYKFAHPQWLIDHLKSDWPDDYQNILTANNNKADQWLRVNRLMNSVQSYQLVLQEQGIRSELVSELACGLHMPLAVPTDLLPGFGHGLVSVQDGASQLPVSVLDLQPALDVLDACAAPGGKTAQILETCPNLSSLTVIDKSENRLDILRDNLQRLDLLRIAQENACKLQVKCGDAVELQNQGQLAKYDRILLDAPCTATGVIRRHPDIKYLRQPSDIESLMRQQFELLKVLWQSLKPDGILVYSTCSVLKAENEQQIARFLNSQKEARVEMPELNVGRAVQHGRQILPGDAGMDGFYFVRLRRSAH